MKPPENPGFCRIHRLFASQFSEAMENNVDDHHIGIEAINSGREHEIEMESVDAAIPGAADGIQKQPEDEFRQVRARHGRDFVPKDRSGIFRAWDTWLVKGQILDAI